MTRGPPVFRVALAFAAGAALAPAAPAVPTGLPPFALYLTLLVLLWRRPTVGVAVLPIALVAGLLWARTVALQNESPCLDALEDGAGVRWEGYLLEAGGSSASRFQVTEGLGPGCEDAPVRTWFRDDGELSAGRFGVLTGRWVASAPGSRFGPGYVSGGRFAEKDGPVPALVQLRSRIQERAGAILQKRFGPRSGVAAALVLEERGGIDPALKEAFVRSGSVHLLSVSGFHVGVIGGILAGCAALFGRSPRFRAWAVMIGVWAYVLLIGLPTAACRAAWMTTALLMGSLRGRPVLQTGALGAAMLVLALAAPEAVSGPSYQLTVAGTAGLMTLGRWGLRHLPEGRVWAKFGPPVAAGIGASVVTAPILAFHFGELSLLSVPSTIILSPLVAAAIPGIMAVLIWDLTGIPGGGVLAYPIDGLLLAVESVTLLLGRVPWATISVTGLETTAFLAGAWAGVAALRTPWAVPAWARIWLAVCAGGAGLMLTYVVRDLTLRNTVQITAIDVGQGDAIALRTPRGRWILVDAGPRTRTWDAGAERVVPFLESRGVRRLEAVVLSHPDEDHAGGLAAVLQSIPVRAVLDPGRTVGQSGHRDALAVATEEGIPWRRVVTGDTWTLDGMVLTVLHPDSTELGDHPNDWSVVLHVRYGAFDALLMGDAERVVEERVMASLPQGGVEVLKVGHHGSRTSSSGALVERVRPRVALISVGGRNRYGHPAPVVLRRLAGIGAVILRTDVGGTVRVTGRKDGSIRWDGSRP